MQNGGFGPRFAWRQLGFVQRNGGRVPGHPVQALYLARDLLTPVADMARNPDRTE